MNDYDSYKGKIKNLEQKIVTLEKENEELKRLQGTTKDLYAQGVFEEVRRKTFDYFLPIAKAVSAFSSIVVIVVTAVGVKEFISLNKFRKNLEENAETRVQEKIDEVTKAAKEEVNEVITLELKNLIDESRTRELLRVERKEEIAQIRNAYDQNFVIHKNLLNERDKAIEETRQISQYNEANLLELQQRIQSLESRIETPNTSN